MFICLSLKLKYISKTQRKWRYKNFLKGRFWSSVSFFLFFKDFYLIVKITCSFQIFYSVKYRGWTNKKSFFSLFFIVFIYKMVAFKMSCFPAFAEIFRERLTRNQNIKKIYNLYSFGYHLNYNQKFLLKKNKMADFWIFRPHFCKLICS